MIVHQIEEAKGNVIWTELMRGGTHRWPPGWCAQLHRHDGAEEVFVFLQGICEVSVEGESRTVRAGEFVFVPREAKHTLRNVGDDDLVVFLVVAPNLVPSHTFFNDDGSPRLIQARPA